MEVPPAAAADVSNAPAPEIMSPWARAVAVFARPGSAWTGLDRRAQWWFPLVVLVVVGLASAAILHDRAVVPMITERWEQMVDSGQMTAEQLQRMEAGMRGPGGLIMTLIPQLIAMPLIMLLLGLGISLGVGFLLGTKLKFRLAFEIANWASLVTLPATVITSVLAWSKETMRGIHLGLGVLVPMSDPPEKLQVGLASFLDAIGPFNLWFLVVAVIGAAALSGAPRKSVAWVLGGLYVALAVVMAALAAVFNPGT
jgi:hypothetical protein